MAKIIRKRYDLPSIAAAEKTTSHSFDLEKHATRVKGILLVADMEQMPFYRGSLQIMLNGEEVIPDQFHAKLLQSGLGVAPKDRFFPLDLPTGNRVVKVFYTDNPSPTQSFAAYNVSLYLAMEMEE